MNKLYLIQWKSRVNGRAGKGAKLFGFEEGQRVVEELNLDYPEIHHELLEQPPPPGPSTQAEFASSEQRAEPNPEEQAPAEYVQTEPVHP
jgi:hypothetical protein